MAQTFKERNEYLLDNIVDIKISSKRPVGQIKGLLLV
jgi:hypothetical protein